MNGRSTANYHRIIRCQVPIPDDEIVVCGMAVGYRDPDAREFLRSNQGKCQEHGIGLTLFDMR